MTELRNPLRILLVAYACSPIRGGEHLLGWEWATRLASRHSVTVLTRAARLVESESCRPPNLTMIGVDDSKFAFLRSLGRLGFYPYYLTWQFAAAAIGRKMLQKRPFDIVHQITFHTYRFPNRLVNEPSTPFVWGPVAGLEKIPIAVLPVLGAGAGFELLRAASNWISPRLPSVRRALRQARAVIVSNSDTMRHLQAVCSRQYILLPANAVSLDVTPIDGFDAEILQLLAIGSIIRMRPYDLILKAISGLDSFQRDQLRLTFVGTGSDKNRLERLVKKLHLTKIVTFVGQLSREEAVKKMRDAHMLVFQSLRDSGSSSVCEAMSVGLPVLALNLAGPSAMLAQGGGFLINPNSSNEMVNDIRQVFVRILEDRQILQTESRRAIAVARYMFDWNTKITQLEEIYAAAVRKPSYSE